MWPPACNVYTGTSQSTKPAAPIAITVRQFLRPSPTNPTATNTAIAASGTIQGIEVSSQPRPQVPKTPDQRNGTLRALYASSPNPERDSSMPLPPPPAPGPEAWVPSPNPPRPLCDWRADRKNA